MFERVTKFAAGAATYAGNFDTASVTKSAQSVAQAVRGTLVGQSATDGPEKIPGHDKVIPQSAPKPVTDDDAVKTIEDYLKAGARNNPRYYDEKEEHPGEITITDEEYMIYHFGEFEWGARPVPKEIFTQDPLRFVSWQAIQNLKKEGSGTTSSPASKNASNSWPRWIFGGVLALVLALLITYLYLSQEAVEYDFSSAVPIFLACFVICCIVCLLMSRLWDMWGEKGRSSRSPIPPKSQTGFKDFLHRLDIV